MYQIDRQKLFLFIVFCCLGLIFLFLSIEVHEGDIFGFDREMFLWTHSYESPYVTNFALACTFLGSQTFLLPANIILIAVFFFRHKYRAYAWKIAVMSVTSAGFLFLVKYLVKRQRPESTLIKAVVHYSFPSGHTFTSIIFFGIVLYFCFNYFTSHALRILSIILCSLLVLAIAWSRIYLHVHYASDVAGSFCLGFMWLIMAKWFLLEKK